MSITRVYADGNTISGSDMNTIISGINTNETSINGLTTAKVDKVSGKSLVLDTEIAKIHNHTNETILDNTTASYLIAEQTKLSGISTGANVNNISDSNATDLTDTTDTSLHYHSSDRDRSNHTGTQSASTITDFASNVLSTVLTGLSISTNGIISATDTVLSSLGKLQKQISDNLSTLSTHITDLTSHITSAERTLWNGKQSAIVNPTVYTAELQNSWVNNAITTKSAGYYKTIENIIHIQGLIKDGLTANPTLLFTLLEGFRPTVMVVTFAKASNGTLFAEAQINIMTDGKVYLTANSGYNTSLSLEGISFPTF